nr:D-alanyl-D-alanine carboxypeptidase/D-alanyl-D-alanine-endopeptidase [Pseudenhygromyxa sp. WMMC2535]
MAEAGLFALEPAPESAGARIGLVVLDLERGETLYARNPDLALNPASNAKLLTTAAALSELGPEHRYATRLWTDATIDDGAIQGPLYLQGGGDPSLVTGELYELAGELRGLGIRKIQGPIIVDAGRFDRDGLPPGFDQKTEFASYRAPGGAMSVNYNTFEVHAAPGEAVGGALRFVVEPPVDDIVIASEAQTVAGGRNKLWVSSADKRGKTTITFHGEIGVDAPRGSYRYPVSDPSRYAASVLALALEERGIKLRKTTPTTGEVPQDARLLATSRSETLSELCRAVNKWSNNFMAEQILRTLAPGEGATAEAALEVLRAYSREIGMDQRGLVIGNGSGLYANNLVSAHAMTQLLAAVYADFRIRSDYLASLAIMGRDGTTRSRLHDSAASGWIRVKTGTLDDVSALSGYAGSEGSAAPLAFSILMNGLERRDRGQARAVQDAVAELVAAEAVARRARD